jgi:hypothetical protein
MGKLFSPVDELAGHNLLIALGVERSGQNVKIAAQDMWMHREGARTLQLEQAQEALRQRLETAYQQLSHLQDGDRAVGYFAAEQEVINWFANQRQDTRIKRPMSKGRILRTLLRGKKREASVIAKSRG